MERKKNSCAHRSCASPPGSPGSGDPPLFRVNSSTVPSFAVSVSAEPESCPDMVPSSAVMSMVPSVTSHVPSMGMPSEPSRGLYVKVNVPSALICST